MIDMIIETYELQEQFVRENASLYEYIIGEKYSCLESGGSSELINEGVVSAIKDFIINIFKKIGEIFKKFINLFKKDEVEKTTKIEKDIKQIIARNTDDGFTLNCDKSMDLSKYDTINPIKFLDSYLDGVKVEISNLKNKVPVNPQQKKYMTDENYDKETDSISKEYVEVENKIKEMGKSIFIESAMEYKLDKLKDLLVDFEDQQAKNKELISRMEKITKAVNSIRSDAEKIPVDQNPYGLRMLKFKADALQALSLTIVREYSRINQNIVSYANQVFNAFNKHYN